MASAYHQDAWDDHGIHAAAGPEFCDWAIALHAGIQTNHQHCITNHTVELDGDVAHAETYYLFWGENKAGPPTLSFGRYIDRFEQRGGQWRIAYRRCIIEKTENFVDAEPSPALQAAASATGPSRQDRHDISYTRPLTRNTPNI